MTDKSEPSTAPFTEQGTERRKHVRYNDADLSLTVARRGFIGFLKLTPTVDCLDFSLSGLQFSTARPCKPDEKLVLDLKVNDLELSEINAVVVDCEQQQNGSYCVRTRFCFEEKRMKHHKIKTRLLQIADRLRVLAQYPD